MKPILVLAGNSRQYTQWSREFAPTLEALGVSPVYIYPKSFKYLGYSNCHFVLVGTVHEAGYPPEMFSYFDSHNVTVTSI